MGWRTNGEFIGSKEINRKKYGENIHILLVEQVEGVCPHCLLPLIYEKASGKYKGYELAHIYPLNPTAEEITLLKDQKRLSSDPNHEANLIPLCESCHGALDKPRTIQEYQNLVTLKEELLRKSAEKRNWHQFGIEDDIKKIIDSLHKEPNPGSTIALNYDPKTIDQKTDSTINYPTKLKIKDNVRNYFPFIKQTFVFIESENPGSSDVILSQVRSYYTKLKQTSKTQQQLYEGVRVWLKHRISNSSEESVDILTSFFVQNCEIFS